MDPASIQENIVYLWLVAGGFMVALEAFAIPGIGFLFAGLGAITTAILIQINYADRMDYVEQFVWFFISAIAWTVVLWGPLKRMRMGGRKAEVEYKNIIGTTATISKEPLKRGISGRALWSGAPMAAKMAESCPQDEILPGTEVEVVDIRGITLIVNIMSAHQPAAHH